MPKDDARDSSITDAAVVDDELTPEAGGKDDQQTVPVQKTGWLKTVLIITAIILLGIGLIIQFGNIDSKPAVPFTVQTPVMKKVPGSSPFKETSAVLLPSKNENHIREDASTEILKMPGESKQGAESVKMLYPYSIKLSAVRTLTEAQKLIAFYRQKGLSPYWVNVDLGDQGVWYRIFTGYFKDMEQAENIIKRQKLTNAKVKKTEFAALIGIYRSETTLNDQVKLIAQKGFSPYVVKGANSEFYLYVGAFYTYRGAKEQYADLLTSGIESKVVER
ncbi:MAG: SPOR domain-containing protein [Deltaproteobacteria bacterium]|nr:SPOR domain-containing protein [Deltaproteobacteria bacterium]